MDFTKFDSKEAGAKGAWLHVVDPSTGEPIYVDEAKELPCRVKVLGSESAQAQTVLRALQKSRAKDDDKKAKSQGDIHRELVAVAAPLIMDFENIDRGSVSASKDDADWFLNLQVTNGQADEKSFAEQVVTFAFKRGSFLGNAPKN